ncbi:MAG TPA: L-rhamnose mutarotase [Devosia sp.]|jgi:hypothetical protein|uniref:L-rhamnose mutarotase n=1 Tax=Devosia sp. TaxID=1871048 RepID=UPI002DDCD6F6|nr:L-rhamnose mutarotase [Devosia sp.]HEV2515801.1 L-rhamnose mutarotase [Devosia sp.]
MTRDPRIAVSMARLHPDKIALYERIHDEMTAEHAADVRTAYRRIDVYRLGDLLIMLTEQNAGPLPVPTAAEEARDRAWHASLAECFPEPWRPADPIFSLAVAGSEHSRRFG